MNWCYFETLHVDLFWGESDVVHLLQVELQMKQELLLSQVRESLSG